MQGLIGLIIVLLIVLLAVLTIAKTIRVIQQGSVGVVPDGFASSSILERLRAR